MNKTEKIISAVSAMLIGIFLMVFKGGVLTVLNAVVGVVLVALGVFDLIKRNENPNNVKMGIIKCVIGVLILAFGWLILEAVLYVFAGLLLIVGICWIYDLIRCGVRPCNDWRVILEYVKPAVCLLIGLLLFFNQGGAVNWIFVVCGICSVVEGALLLFTTLIND